MKKVHVQAHRQHSENCLAATEAWEEGGYGEVTLWAGNAIN